MPAGGGSGEGGLAARGYNGPAQPGGNYGGTNVVGTGGGFLGDRSALNAAVLAGKVEPPKTDSTVARTLKPAVPKPKPMPVVKIVKNPLTGGLIAIDDVTGQPIPNYDFNMPYSPSPWDNYPLGGKPLPAPGPKIQDRVGTGSSGFMGAPPSLGPGSTHQPSNGGFGDVNNQQGPSADVGTGGDVSGGGLLGGSPSGMGDIGAQRMMMAAPEGPLVSPGPIGPGGQPMGNQPPPFQWGARDLALRHGMEQMMRHRQQMARRPQYGRNEQAQRVLRAAARRGRA